MTDPSLTSYDNLTPEEALRKLEADADKGLSREVADRRLAQYGENALEEKRVSPLVKFLSYFWGPIPWMIEVAGVLAAIVHEWADFSIIVIMLLVNALVGFWQEFQADNAIALLKQRLAPAARVLRDGKWQDLPAKLLVPGDIVLVALGNVVPADIKLLAGAYLSVDQSALTGESLPVDKAAGDIAFSGTIVRQGEMKAVVVATGMSTFFGKTARLVGSARTVSHFQRAVLKIGNFLIVSTIALVALILVVALFRHDPLIRTLLFALILTVAAIPVALPAVLSVTMAVGAQRLAGMRAIVSRLVAIEEMAGMDVLCSDKTGTLTKNELTLGDTVLLEAENEADVLVAAALASQSDHADAIDQTILKATTGSKMAEALGHCRVGKFEPFDPVHKRSEAEVQREGTAFRVAKGAPQAILELGEFPNALAEELRRKVDELAAKGYRPLGVARTDETGKWRYLGLLSLFDPPRDDSAATIDAARKMGVSVKMVTGDHVAIAKEIAGKLHLRANILVAKEAFGDDGKTIDRSKVERADGFAQVFPEHKFLLVKALEEKDHIVGMTGDGVNDAPALKQADVGIAVSGATDAARAAADLVLTAPGLSVITAAIEEARRIFERMNSYATYRISETIRVLLFMTLSILVFNFYPVTAIMIILLALLNDFPIMMIAYDNAPNPNKPVRWDMRRVLAIAAVLGVYGVIETFVFFWLAEQYLHLPRPTIQTFIFLKLLVSGHLVIYLTRNVGTVWQRPWPSWKLFVTTEATQVIGTLAAVYGWLIEPIGWSYALIVWGWGLVGFALASLIKIMAYKLLEHRMGHHVRHLDRVEGSLHSS
jgi:H+-transporting ATPase